MKKLVAIGEALIDFIPAQSGRGIKEVEEFRPVVGGAPANVCGAFVKLGGEASFITQLGKDPFADKILEEFGQVGIGCGYILQTDKANTSLAFVALKEDGNREFSFYRKPGADMLLEPDRIKREWFHDSYALHFCSVSLGNYPMKEAHKRAIQYSREAGLLISFDPNLRRPLWNDDEGLKETVGEFLPQADILKISDEELGFITGKTEKKDALGSLFQGNVKLVIYTKGADGAECYTRKAKAAIAGKPVKAVDTTGAGDAFIGSYLYQLYENGITKETISELTAAQMERYLAFSNAYCGQSVLAKGAIASYPDRERMEAVMAAVNE